MTNATVLWLHVAALQGTWQLSPNVNFGVLPEPQAFCLRQSTDASPYHIAVKHVRSVSWCVYVCVCNGCAAACPAIHMVTSIGTASVRDIHAVAAAGSAGQQPDQ
jgi:hypothetical protein